MSMKCIERAFSLLIAVLMVTTAFIPAVGAAEPNAVASSVNIAGNPLPDKTTSATDMSGTVVGTAPNGASTAETKKDLPLFPEDNRSRYTLRTNTSIDTGHVGGPDGSASPATGTTRVVTGSGKTKLKIYDRETKTIRIKDDGRSATGGGDDELEIRLVNATPDLGTFTETFEITAHPTIVLDGSEDFLATWALHSGNMEGNATQAEWFIWEEQSHSIEIPIIEYREVTIENNTPGAAIVEGVLLDSIVNVDGTLESVTSEGTTPVSVTFENISPEDVSLEAVVQEDIIPEKDDTPVDVSPEDTVLETVTIRVPYIAGTETVEQSWPEWVPFTPDGRTLNAGETRLFKVVYTKPAELGQVDINTAPVFRGVACPEMTWWSTAWAYRVPVTVASPPSIDGYPHREVVVFRTGMQADFDDVRFVTNDGIVLDYWKEAYTASDSAVIWVNLPAGTTSIWMYYGSGTATDIGSRDNAYVLYDDFNGPSLDTTLWTDTTPGAHYFSNGWIYDTRSRGAGVLVSNDYVITNGEPVIAEMSIHVNNLPESRTFCGYFPLFIDTPANGVLWYPLNDRYIIVGSDMSLKSGVQRGLFIGLNYLDTCIVTPSGLTHSVTQTMNGNSFSYTDVFSRGDGLSNHRMYILGGDNSVPGRSIRMDWIRVRKYVQTEPAFTYGTPQSGPIVTIISPHDDTVPAGGNVTVAGNVADPAITSLTLTHNGVASAVSVQDGNFSMEVTLAVANTITVGGTDSLGNPFSTTLLLDGDMLPAAYEQAIGFDPLNADSDCSQWSGNQAGNGIIDGYEIFAGDLPVFAKARIGADPFVVDTDGDGLTDSFELLKLGTFPEEPGMMSVMGEGGPIVAAGTDDDPDGDGLSNLEEQTYGTDPLSADTDKDGLSDADEILRGTDPCAADTDGDGLDDGAEAALGTDPLNPDSNGNGVLDGAEDYWSGDRFLDDTLGLTVFGRGYAVANVSVAAVNYTHLISDEILVSNVSAIGFGDDIESGTIAIAYDPTHVVDPSRLSIYRFDDDLGTFVNVSSTVDATSGVVSCAAEGSAKYAVMDSVKWEALFADLLGASSTMETMDLPGEDLTPRVLMPPEALVEAVDYGVAFYDEPPAWYLAELEAEALTGVSNEAVEIEEENGSEGILLDAEIDGSYQAVANGMFLNGQHAWAPSGPYYPSTIDGGAEVDTYQNDWTSGPRSLKINVWAKRDWVECTVAHANVDLTNVDTLTFRYKCIESVDGGNLASSGLRFWIDGYGNVGLPNFRDPGIGDQRATVTPNWQTATVDVSGMDGQRTICFRVFVAVDGPSGTSTATYLIDDVMAWSSEPPADPNTANVRFHIKDSLDYAGVPDARVTCHGVEEITDSRGNTYDFFVTAPGVLSYYVESAGYKDHYGFVLISPDDLGTSHTEYIDINSVSTATGDLYVSSTPDNAEIYVDGIYCGHTNGIVPDILAESGYNQHTVEVRKEGYTTVSRTVYVNAGQQPTSVHFDLTAHVGAIAVTSSPPGAAVYLDSAYQGTTSAASGQLTLPGLPVGAHRLDVLKEGYAPFTATVMVVKDQTVPVTATLTNEDLDGDGLPDYYEENGYRDGFGRWHAPDPYLIDTDGDGLSDGYEAGELVTEGGKTFFKPRSDPTKADTDDDGLDDYLEDAIGSDPLNPDSDGDGLSDALEWEIGTDLWSADTDGDGHSDYEEWYDPDYDPLVFEERYGPLEMGREFLLGAVLGEWGADDHDNVYYLAGWVASGVLVIGDLRDIAATISRGDLVGTGLNLAALIPGYGDAAKVAAVVGKFVLKHPELIKPAMVLLVGVAPHVDEAAETLNALRKAHGDDVINRLLRDGITENELKVVVSNRGNLLRTLTVVKRSDGKVIWLEEGKLGTAAGATSWVDDKKGTGWVHIVNNHINHPTGNQFRKAFGAAYEDQGLIKELILDCAKTGLQDTMNPVAYWKKIDEEHFVQVVIGSNGYVRTAYPRSLDKVPAHVPGMFS